MHLPRLRRGAPGAYLRRSGGKADISVSSFAGGTEQQAGAENRRGLLEELAAMRETRAQILALQEAPRVNFSIVCYDRFGTRSAPVYETVAEV